MKKNVAPSLEIVGTTYNFVAPIQNVGVRKTDGGTQNSGWETQKVDGGIQIPGWGTQDIGWGIQKVDEGIQNSGWGTQNLGWGSQKAGEGGCTRGD
ncbi:MAG: hypothetical protein LBG30_04665 [Odoribacteraceae bacterium]|jgi:hypothetical protein|nr:hypothetical protein [Odoribacteraceae bacterium]